MRQKIEHVSERLRWLLGRLGKNQTRIAQEANISRGQVTRTLSGDQAPSADLMEFLALEHQVNLSWLLAGLGEPFLEITPPGPQGAVGLTREQMVDMARRGEPMPVHQAVSDPGRTYTTRSKDRPDQELYNTMRDAVEDGITDYVRKKGDIEAAKRHPLGLLADEVVELGASDEVVETIAAQLAGLVEQLRLRSRAEAG